MVVVLVRKERDFILKMAPGVDRISDLTARHMDSIHHLCMTRGCLTLARIYLKASIHIPIIKRTSVNSHI